MLTLEVQDQGAGIDPDKLKAIAECRTAGLGLRGMKERLNSMDGEFQIISDRSGTLVSSIVPLAPFADMATGPFSEGPPALK